MVERLEGASDVQKAMLGLGAVLQCPTVTANGRLISKAACQGVNVVCLTHHAVWLTGM